MTFAVSVVFSQGLKQNEGANAVYVKVLEGVSHAVNVVDLPGQMKDVVLLLDQVVHGELVSHIGNVDLYLVLNLLMLKRLLPCLGSMLSTIVT